MIPEFSKFIKLIETDSNFKLDLFTGLLESNPRGVVITDPYANIIFTNSNYLKLVGLSKDQVIGKNCRVFKSGYTKPEVYDDLWRTLRRDKLPFTAEFINKNGNNLYNEKSLIYPILNSDGQIQYLVGVKEDITSYKKEENELIEKARLANFDQLTELPNRVLLEDRIKTTLLNSKRHDERLSGLFFMDLDEFKIINDTYGHGFGDSLLKGVAKRLNLISRESDTVARFGGDEFVMFFPELENINILEGIAKKIINSINEPYNISGESLNIGISIGITYSNGNETYEDFIKRADFAMYDAKNIGKNNFFLIKQ